MPLTPYIFTNTNSIPVGATKKLKAKEHKSSRQFEIWRFRLVARTHASHAWNTGSIPVGATSVRTLSGSIFFACVHRRLTKLAIRNPRFARPIAASLVD